MDVSLRLSEKESEKESEDETPTKSNLSVPMAVYVRSRSMWKAER